MPSSAAIGARVVLLFREEDIERKEYGKEDADFNHRLRSARPECPLLRLRMC